MVGAQLVRRSYKVHECRWFDKRVGHFFTLKKAVVGNASLIAKNRSELEINARVIIIVDMIINTFELLMTGVRSLTR